MAETNAATTTTSTAAAGATTTPAATSATKKAKAWKSRGYVTGKDVKQFVQRKEAAGKTADVSKFLENQLAKGYGVGAAAVNKYAQRPAVTSRSLMGSQLQGSSANVGGMRGLELGRGQVYMGASRVTTPRRDYVSVGSGASGHSWTPGTTDYARSIMPKSLVRQAKRQQTVTQPAQTTLPA